MAVSFIGNTSWIQRAEPVWTVDSWGADHCRVLYRGARTGKTTFENGLTRWSAMPGFPGMRLERWNDVEMTPWFPGVELHYVGFRGTVPNAKSIDSFCLQQAQGQGVDSATHRQVTGTFTYRASRTTWVWFETSEPYVYPRYNTVRSAVNPFDSIVGYSIQDVETDRPVNTVNYSAFVAVFNSLRQQAVASGYEREMLVPGALWACRADIDWKLTN